MCFFKVKNSIGHVSGMVGPIDVKRKGGALVGYWVNYVTLTFHLTYDLDLLSHPSLGWLYVFSSFPPPRPPPPPPQWLLLLTSKPFELPLRYLGQRKYRSGKIYWMTFRWPWLKVTAVTLINKNLVVCRVKWEPLNQSLQNLIAISPYSWLSPD